MGPRTLRTPLNTPYTPYTPYTPNNSNRVKHFEPVGLSSSLKEIDFNAYAMRGEVNKSNQSKRSNCSGGYMSRTLGMDGMDGMLELLRG